MFIWLLLTIFWVYRVIVLIFIQNRKINPKKIKFSEKYYIILPVYKEELLIKDTLNYYKLLLENYNNVYLIVVWTCNERNIYWENNTLKLAKKFEGDNIIILESDIRWWNMATQVNFSVNYIRYVLKENIDSTYFHLINIDSRISNKSLNEAFSAIDKWSNILLQSTFFISNYNKLNSIQRAIAIYQSRRTLVEEQYRLLVHNKISKYKLYHVVWHGLIIRLKEYYKYKMLPEDTINEDLHFWFYLSINGENVYSLTSYEYGDTPNTFLSWFKQTISWFYWNIEYYKYPKLYMKKFSKKFSFKILLFTIQWFFNTLKWFLTSYCLWLLLVSYIIYGNIYWLVWFIAYYIHYYIFFYRLLKKYQKLKFNCNDIFSILLIPMIVSIPLTISVIKYILYKLWLLSFIKNKTQHE